MWVDAGLKDKAVIGDVIKYLNTFTLGGEAVDLQSVKVSGGCIMTGVAQT